MLQVTRLRTLHGYVIGAAKHRTQLSTHHKHIRQPAPSMLPDATPTTCSSRRCRRPKAFSATTAVATDNKVILTDADLQRYAQQHGIPIEFLTNTKPITDPDTVKSLVFMANGQPVMVVVAGPDKVEERKVADHLGVARRRVRLATQQEAQEASGFAVGTVAPFGHPQPLRTLVDVAVTRNVRVYCGSGKLDVDMAVSVADLLQHTRAEVLDVAAGQRQEQQEQQMARDAAAAAAQLLPLPWAAGSEMVRLTGVIAQRRRIAKLLLFSVLVPESVPVLPEQASYMRRLWRNPDTGKPFEVQLIMGKTLERALDREAAIQLMDRVKSGCIVSVVGRVQPNLGPGGSSRPEVMDVVCHHVNVLYKNKDVLERGLRRARRAGHKHVRSAEDLQQLALLGHAFDDMYAEESGSEEGSDAEDAGAADGSREVQAAASSIGAAGEGTAAGAVVSSRAPASGDDAGAVVAAVAAVSSSNCWALQLPAERIHVVSDLQGVQQMHAAVFGAHEQAQEASSSRGDSSSTAQICGIDCEWEPFERGQAKTPVALLQLAFRDQIFLVDLLQLCQPGRDPTADVSTLGQTELAFSHFFGQLMATEAILKLGFQLGSDLDRLHESYPSLPCFRQLPSSCNTGSNGIIRGHVDIIQLARALNPRLANLAQTSLSRLVQAVLGQPLDKTQQRSCWAERPLTAEQVVYAATDASCLVALFDELVRDYPNARQMDFLRTMDNGLRRLPFTQG